MPSHGSAYGQQSGHGRGTGDDDDLTLLGLLLRSGRFVSNGSVLYDDGHLILIAAFIGLDIIGQVVRSDQLRIGGFNLRIVFDDDVRGCHRVVK